MLPRFGCHCTSPLFAEAVMADTRCAIGFSLKLLHIYCALATSPAGVAFAQLLPASRVRSHLVGVVAKCPAFPVSRRHRNRSECRLMLMATSRAVALRLLIVPIIWAVLLCCQGCSGMGNPPPPPPPV